MEKSLKIKILKIDVEVKLKTVPDEETLGFARVHFLDDKDEPVLKIRGFRIKRIQSKTGKSRLFVDFPAFQTGRGYMKSIIAEGNYYVYIVNAILTEYKGITNDETVVFLNENDEINPNDIPL